MGQLTRGELIAQGLRQAGNTGLSELSKVWLNAWLRSQYAAWPWPFLRRKVEGLQLGTGVNSLVVGGGEGGVSYAIRRIHDPLRIYRPDYSLGANVRVQSAHEYPLGDDETVQNPATNRGLPERVRCEQDTGTWGQWTLYFNRTADRDYLLKLSIVTQPEDMADDATVPLYPNDRTLLQAVKVEAMLHMKHDDRDSERDVLAAMVVDDRVKFGEALGVNDHLGLDPKVFR
jgi:hypothetical protein